METFSQTQEQNSERALIIAAQSGDIGAFKLLYENYHERVYNLIFYSLGDRLLAEDLLQSVFIKLYRALPNFRFEASFNTWVYRITLNECQDQRRRRADRFVPLETILGSGEEIDPASLPDERHADHERRQILQQAMLELSPKLRDVVVLKYLEELSYDEIAEVLNCAAGTVASRLNRALTELETRLRPLRRLL